MTEPDADSPQWTLEQARASVAAIMPTLDEFIALRADLAEIQTDLTTDGVSPAGGRAEAKAIEARLHDLAERIVATGAQFKGYAPLLLDYPGERDGVPVLWCWLEGDSTIDWYHRQDCGFPGRRPVD